MSTMIEVNEIMNHDYAHCSDFKETCPFECFRAQLVRDLRYNPQRFTSWIHFKLTDDKECPLCTNNSKGERDE